MKHYRDKAKECEEWYHQIKRWDGLIKGLMEVPACTVGKEESIVHMIENSQTAFDRHYKELFWAHNSNPRPSGRKRLSLM